MGTRTSFTYFLPITAVRLRCTVTASLDTVLGKNARTSSGLSVDLVTMADPDSPRTLAIESGLWRDHALKLALTEDGRLTAAGVETTGQAGKAIVSAASAAVSVAALAAGCLPLAIGAGAAASVTKSTGFAPSETREDPVAAAYAKAQPAAAERFRALTAERANTVAAVDKARKAYLGAADDPSRPWWRRAYRSTREVLSDVEAELEGAKTHFAAWRKTTVKELAEAFDLLVPLGALPTFDGTGLSFPPGHHGAAVRRLFDESGEVLALTNSGRRSLAVSVPDDEAVSRGATATLHVRRPHEVELVVASGRDASAVTVTATRRELVMEHSCDEVELPVRKSWNAKRRVDIALSALGAVTVVELSGASSAASGAAAATQATDSLPGAIAAASKARAARVSLASSAEDDELTRLKRAVALEEQRLLAAGQAATGQDYARLARLKQAAEIADLEAKIKKQA